MSASGLLSNDLGLAEVVLRQSLAHADGRLAYLQDFSIETPLDIIILAPLRLIYFLFSPFLWALPLASDLLISVEGLIYLMLIIMMIKTQLHFKTDVQAFPLWVMLGSMLLIFSFGSSNSGTAFRHKAKIAPLMIAMVALPSSGRRPRAHA